MALLKYGKYIALTAQAAHMSHVNSDDLYRQELMSAENAPYKVSCMFTPTSLRSQQVAIITAGELLGIHTSHSIVTSKLVNTSNL